MQMQSISQIKAHRFLPLLLLLLLQLLLLHDVQGVVPKITNLNVKCDETGMRVNVDFDVPFNGIIFSKGHYSDNSCRFVNEKNASRNQFVIPINGCGTSKVNIDIADESVEVKGFENVIVIQNNPKYQEVWDSVRMIVCRYSEQLMDSRGKEKRVVFRPFTVDMLDVITVPVSNLRGERHSVDCWMDITKGNYPQTSPIEGSVKVGENLTMTIYIKDPKKMTDIRVKDCYAYDNREDAERGGEAILQLTSEQGCPINSKLITSWKTTTNDTKSTGATVITFTTIRAFKFPERESVHLSCSVELCARGCRNLCLEKEEDEGETGAGAGAGAGAGTRVEDEDEDEGEKPSENVETGKGTTPRPGTEGISLTSRFEPTLPEDLGTQPENKEEAPATGGSDGEEEDSEEEESGALNEEKENEPKSDNFFSGQLDLTTTTTELPTTSQTTSTMTTTVVDVQETVAALEEQRTEDLTSTTTVLTPITSTTASTTSTTRKDTTDKPAAGRLIRLPDISQDEPEEENEGSLEQERDLREHGRQPTKSVTATKRRVVSPPNGKQASPYFPPTDTLPSLAVKRRPSRLETGSRKSVEGTKKGQLREDFTASEEGSLRRVPAFIPRPSRRSSQQRKSIKNRRPVSERFASRPKPRPRVQDSIFRSGSNSRTSWHIETLPERRDPGFSDIPFRLRQPSRSSSGTPRE